MTPQTTVDALRDAREQPEAAHDPRRRRSSWPWPCSALVFARLYCAHPNGSHCRPLAKRLRQNLSRRQLGAPNVVTGILLTYRAFDTLGEVAVLFMVAAGVGLMLGRRERRNAKPAQGCDSSHLAASEIVRTGAQFWCR